MTDNTNVPRLLRSPKTIRARLEYNPPPQALPNPIRTSQQFLPDKPVPVSPHPQSYSRSSLLNEPTDAIAHSSSPKSSTVPITGSHHPDVAVIAQTHNSVLPDAVDDDTVGDLKNSFVQRKVERDQCSKEFSEFLGTIASASTTNASNAHSVIEADTNFETIHISGLPELAATERIHETLQTNESSSVEPNNDLHVELKTAVQKCPPNENITKKKKLAVSNSKHQQFRTEIPLANQNVNSNNADGHPPPSQQTKCPVTIPRTKPPVPLRQKSTINIPLLKNTSPEVKHKSSSIHADRQPSSVRLFDSARARKHMAEQQKKRMLARRSDADGKIALSERKRRLAELQRHTRQIVQRNVTKKAAKCARIAINVPEKHDTEQSALVAAHDEKELSAQPTQRPFITKSLQQRGRPDRSSKQFVNDESGAVAVITPIVPNATDNANTETPTAMPANDSAPRRVGILRRIDASPPNSNARPPIPSPLNIPFGELIASSQFHTTNQLETNMFGDSSARPKPFIDDRQTLCSPQSLQMPDVQLQSSATINSNPSTAEPLFRTPPKTGSAADAVGARSTRSGNETTVTNVPYWLRPSAMQIYPYNFIMAVRKKLELIVNPTLKVVDKPPKSPSSSRHSYFKKKSSRTPGGLSKTSPDIDMHLARAPPTVQTARTDTMKPTKRDIVSDSDALTTLSSMSLQLPASNSRSLKPMDDPNVKPTQNQSDSDSQATLSMSSAILSQSSPDKTKKPPQIRGATIEPLSTDAITAMQLSSSTPTAAAANGQRSKSSIRHPFVNCRRGSAAPSASSAHSSRRHWSSNGNSRTNISGSKSSAPITLDRSNILDMLDSFNRSLSHAISVNQQLHETLSRPPPKTATVDDTVESSARTATKSTNGEYSSKFDSTISSLQATGQTATASESASMLVIESGIPVTVSSLSSVITESIPTDLSIPTVSSRSNEVRPAPAAKSASDSTTASTRIPFSHPKHTEAASISSPSSAMQKSSIRTNIESDRGRCSSDDMNDIRTFDQSYGAVPSERCLDANNSLATDASPLSTGRLLKPATTPLHSARSSTLTIKSMRIESNTSTSHGSGRNGHNKENVSNNSYATKTSGPMAADTKLETGAAFGPDQSIGSDIFAVFNQTDVEFSSVVQTGNAIARSSSTTTTIMSEANISYSTLGMYDRLLKTEDQKSLDLTALLKVREKALMDRTKGQIAWLELQKQQFQQRGLTAEITAVKKKQRALLLRMERDRAELAKSAKQSASITETPARPKQATVLRLSHMKTPAVRRSSSPSMMQRSQQRVSGTPATPKSALRAIDFAADTNVEAMLQQREERLRQRRAHVESLVRWHQRLDDEECAVAKMEEQLMVRTNEARLQHQLQHHQYEQSPLTSQTARNQQQRQRRQIRNIEHSLEVLHALPSSGHQPSVSISEPTATTVADVLSQHDANECDGIERVHLAGSKLNRLWRRLTGESGCKFIPDRRYELTKADIAGLYEEAKRFVLGQFCENGRSGGVQVLDQSQMSRMSVADDNQNPHQTQPQPQQRAEVTSNGPNVLVNTAHHPHTIAGDEFIVVPALNLNFTSTEEQSMSDAEGAGGVSGCNFSSVSGFYFTENVQPMQQPIYHQQLLLSNDTESTQNLNESAKTFYIQTVNSNTLRDSAFSVDSLNSSRPEVSEATGANVADEWPPSYIVPLRTTAPDTHETIADTNGDDAMVESTEPENDRTITDSADRTLYIADISCPAQMMENSMITSINGAAYENPTPGQIDIDSTTASSNASDDNDHMLQVQQQLSSYSDSFEPTTTITTTASDKITEAIEPTDDNCDDSLTRISEAMVTSGLNPPQSKISDDLEISSKDISERISSVSSLLQEQSSEQTRSNDDQAATDVESQIVSFVIEETTSAGASSSFVDSKSDILPTGDHLKRTTVAAEPSQTSPTYKMPDIISEAEVLRRQQMRIEEEIKQLEEENAAAPYVYIREIPNKPPPPYVPPAHGSPMTAIFPSDSRIQSIVYRRVEQLQSSGSDATVADEHITNIYERIALDICAECMDELPLQSLPHACATGGDAQRHFKHPLAFYNPPDRLQCIQQHVLHRVKKLLRHPYASAHGGSANVSHAGASANTAAMANDDCNGQQSLVSSPAPVQSSINYVKRLLVGGVSGGGNNWMQYAGGHSGAKRKLWWNDILLQEMMEDDASWTNFDSERTEVLDTVGEEIMRMLVTEALVECERTYERKAVSRSRRPQQD